MTWYETVVHRNHRRHLGKIKRVVYIFAEDALDAFNRLRTNQELTRHERYFDILPLSEESSRRLESRITGEGLEIEGARSEGYVI